MSEQTYPNKCCRCGLCCLVSTCPIGMRIYGVEKNNQCPGLKFDGDIAVCQGIEYYRTALLPENKLLEAFGIGAGCCILAHWFKDGIEFDFADLPDAVKIESVRQIRKSYEI